MRTSLKAKPATASFFDAGAERLQNLCRASGLDKQSAGAVDLFARMTSPWGRDPIPPRARWRSDVGDDNTPFEFSITIGRSAEVRILVEPLGATPSLKTNRDAALRLLASLERDYSLDLSRFHLIKDLFLPPNPQGNFSIWLAAQIGADKEPDFKLYLNPEARGKRLAPALIEETLVRLGFGAAWPFVGRGLLRRGPELDELNYFSLDLLPSPEARVKVYARHSQCTAQDLEIAAQAALSHQPGDLKRFVEALVPGMGPMYLGRPPQSCFTFVESQGDRPAATTLHFPINGYARNDAFVRERVLASLDEFGLDDNVYASCIDAFANRPLGQGIGLHSYISFRRYNEQPRITVYFPLEIFRPGTVAKPPSTPPPSDAVEIADRFERRDRITNHPFLRRLHREPMSPQRLLILGVNLRPLAARQVDQTFADVLDRVEDDRIHAALKARLATSGPGVFPRSQVQPVLAMVEQLEAALRCSGDDGWLAAGRSFESAVDEMCRASDVHEAVGAVVAVKTFGRQIGTFLRDELRRMPGTDVASFDSIAPDSGGELGFAELGMDHDIPHEYLDALWRGACRLREAAWELLDELYALSYPSRTPAPYKS